VVKDNTNLKKHTMKVVKFKKDHVAGLKKGDIRQFDDATANRLIEAGYGTEGTTEDLEAYRIKLSKQKPISTLEEAKAEANKTTGPCLDCQGKEAGEKCEDCGEEEIPEDKYHILTQEDIDANELEAEGLKVGDEVLISSDDELIIGEDGKLIARPEGK
jgi:hypothetical protein